MLVYQGGLRSLITIIPRSMHILVIFVVVVVLNGKCVSF